VASRGNVEITARLRNARKFMADAYGAAHAVDEIGDAANRADAKIAGANARVMLFRNSLGLLKWPAMAAGAGLLVQTVIALGAGVVALTSGLAPLSGLLVAYPALGLAAAQGLGAFAFAMKGVLAATGGLNAEMDPKKLGALSEQGQRLALTFDSMKTPVRSLQAAVQSGLFPGMQSALGKLHPLLGKFRGEMKLTGQALGTVTDRAADFAVGAGPDMQILMRRNATYIERTGTAGISLASALRHVLVAAGPLLGWLTKSLVRWSAYIDRQAEAGRESGKLASFFWKTRVVATKLGHILGNVAGALFGVGKAAAPLGSEMLTGIEKSSAAWEKWSKSATGQRDMRAYFTAMKPTLWELGRLARDLVKAFVKFGNAPGLAPLIAKVRTQLLPVLTKVSSSLTASFGPTLVNAIVNLGQLASAMSGGVGPLTLLVATLGTMASALAWFIRTVPGLKQVATALVTIGLASRALKLATMATGLTKVWAGMKLVKGATNAWTIAVLRQSVVSAAMAVKNGVLTASMWLLNTALYANPVMLVVAGLIALGAGAVLAYKHFKPFRDLVDGIVGILKSVVKWIGKAASAFAGSPLGKIAGFAAKMTPLGIAGSIAHKIIPGLATGGVVRTPGATLVGEDGPELLSMQRGARVDPLPRLAQGMATQTAPSISGALSDYGNRATEITVPVHLDGKVIYEAVARVDRDRKSRR
jgi:hypothetical protein